jgi:2-hydroxy-3-oxopropionate reductase
VSRDLAAQATSVGAEMFDAPASGGDKGAIAGTLSIMVGGEVAAFERAMPIL